MPKIYTRSGDQGQSALFGGRRVPKNHPRLEACGALDEVNCQLGCARAELAPQCAAQPRLQEFDALLARLQNRLFDLGAELACEARPLPENFPRITPADVRQLEQWIDEYDGQLEPLRVFILPGGAPCSAALHLARAVCRRAERACVPLLAGAEISADAYCFLNRLSDLLFVLARWINKELGADEARWNKHAD